jgi:hypothetical protein
MSLRPTPDAYIQSGRTRAAALSGHAVDAVKLDGDPSLGIDDVELGGSGTTLESCRHRRNGIDLRRGKSSGRR